MPAPTRSDYVFWSLAVGLGHLFSLKTGASSVTAALGVVLYLGLQEPPAFVARVGALGSAGAAVWFMLRPGWFEPSLPAWIHLGTLPAAGTVLAGVRRMRSRRFQVGSLLVLPAALVPALHASAIRWRFWPWLILLAGVATLVFTWPHLEDKAAWYDGFFSLICYWVLTAAGVWLRGRFQVSQPGWGMVLFHAMWEPMAADIIILDAVCLIRRYHLGKGRFPT